MGRASSSSSSRTRLPRCGNHGGEKDPARRPDPTAVEHLAEKPAVVVDRLMVGKEDQQVPDHVDEDEPDTGRAPSTAMHHLASDGGGDERVADGSPQTESAIARQDSAAEPQRAGAFRLASNSSPGNQAGGGPPRGHVPADPVGEHVVLDHAGEVPLRRDDVARLVVAGLPVLGFLVPSPAVGAPDVGLPDLK